MGVMNAVKCGACGYQERGLLGVGGDVGRSGEMIVTVSCPKALRLVDTVPQGQGGPVWAQRVSELDAPMPVGRCPARECRSRTHEAWDSRRAVCPRCGEPGMDVRMEGVWD
ncbi:MAG: hypothetical protein PF636_02320 [Actinomycetota bacterium]|nr:hypothetical protein [Actinomycetota bacterium]